MSDPFTIGLAVAGWLASTWLAYRWGLHSQKMQRLAGAHTKFRSAFSDTVAGLECNKYGPYYFIKEFGSKHDCAIVEFRHYLARNVSAAFDRDCEEYRKCCKRAQSPPTQVLLARNNKEFIDQSEVASDLLACIRRLLSYADKT